MLIVVIVLCLALSGCRSASTHSWDFKSVTTSNFVDTGSGTAANIAQTVNFISNDYGAHLSYEKLSITSADIFQDEFFTIYGWFYSHKASGYYLFDEQDGTIDRFCLSVTSSGYYALSMVNSAASEQLKTSTILAQTGWNFFYVKMELKFGYTVLTLGVVNSGYSPVKKTETLSFNGDYKKAVKTFNIGWKVVNSVCTEAFYGSIRKLTIDDTVMADAALDALYTTTWTNDGFLTCGICALIGGTGKWYEVLETTPKIKYLSLDITSTTTASTTVSDLSGDSHTFAVSTSAPFRIPLQGYRFGYGKYLKASTGFVLPNSYTVSLWFRMDTTDPASDARMQYLYSKVSSGTDKLYIAVTNKFLRVFVDGASYDYSESFSSNSKWRHLSVSIYQTSASTTGVQIFLDSTKLTTQSLPTVYTDNASYDVYVGKDLAGNIYSFEIKPLLNFDLSAPSMLFTGTWTAYGSTSSCTVCPRTSTTAGTCLSECSLGTYDQNCNACNWKCKYCTAAGANCLSWASSLSGSGAAPVTCTCRPGFYDATTSCAACDSLWGTCSGAGSSNCLTCATNAYWYGSSGCVSSCPTYYKVNSMYKTCELDTTSLLMYVYDSTSVSKGCTSSQFWNGAACQSCDTTCLTWNGSASSNCLSCPLGRYLNNKSWLVCDATYMVVGSSGMWVETWGKSKNFGLLACDNGASAGCTSCTVENSYKCSGGTTTTPDVWNYVYPTFESVTVTDENNLFVYFDREMKAVSSILTTTFKIEITDSSGNAITDFGWEVPSTYYSEYSRGESARYIFIALKINQSLNGGSTAATVKVTYSYSSGSPVFKDLNNAALMDGTSVSGSLKFQFNALSSTEESVITAFGIIATLAVFIMIPLAIGFKGGSREGFVIVILGLQLIYYLSLVDAKYAPNLSGFTQFLRFLTFEFDIMPNFFKALFIKQGTRTEYLIRGDDTNFYKIANSLEFNSSKLIFLFFFNAFWITISLVSLCIKNKTKKEKLKNFTETLVFDVFMVIFMIMFNPFGFTCFAEVQNISRTSPYKIVSIITTFLIIMLMIIFIICLVKIVLISPITTDKKVQRRFNMLQAGIKPSKKHLTFYPLLFTKNILCILIVVLLKSSFKSLSILLTVLSLGTIGGLVYLKPFAQKNANLFASLSEGLLALYFFLGVFYSDDMPAINVICGWIQIIVTIAFIGWGVCQATASSYRTAVAWHFLAAKEKFTPDQLEEEIEEVEVEEEEEEEEHLQEEESKATMVEERKGKGRKRTKWRFDARGKEKDRIQAFEGLEEVKTDDGKKEEEYEEVWVEEEEEEEENNEPKHRRR